MDNTSQFKTIFLNPDKNFLYRGVGGLTINKYNSKLGHSNSDYDVVYFTDDFKYADTYARADQNMVNDGIVTTWTPKKKLKILVLDTKSLIAIRKSITNTQLPNKLINNSLSKNYMILNKGKSLNSVKYANNYKGTNRYNTLTNPSLTVSVIRKSKYRQLLNLVPKNIILNSSNMSNKWTKAQNLLRRIKSGDLLVENLSADQKNALQYLHAFHQHNNKLSKNYRYTVNKLAPLVKIQSNGYSRVSNTKDDTYLYYYILKFAKKYGYDGVYSTTRGIVKNNKTVNSKYKMEFVFPVKNINSLLKRTDAIPQYPNNLLNYMEEYGITLKGRASK